MKWIEISITVERVATEEVTTLFSDYTVNGIIEENIENYPNLVKLTLYGDESKSPCQWVEDIKHELSAIDYEPIDITANIVDENDWLTSWQQYIEPTEILPHLVIKPAWQDYEKKDGDKVIEIDSQLSFGIGAHETTRSCAKLMAKYASQARTCLDIGTGTGILVLVAHYLGIKNLFAIDIDPNAAEQAVHNCKHNYVNAEIICGDLDTDFHGKADLILANLTVDPLKILLPLIGRKLEKGGKLIISGIIENRYDEIMPFITDYWSIVEEVVDNHWHTFVLEAKDA